MTGVQTCALPICIINLNTGSTGNKPKEVPPVPVFAHTDTLYDSAKGYAAAPGKLQSITSRAPAHAPWASAGQGVNVKTSLNSDSELPSDASSSMDIMNEAASGIPVTSPVSIATTATIPNVSSVSAAISSGTTAAMLGQCVKDAALGPAADAIKAGAGIVQIGRAHV